jgi:CubicO group peptidase (beta-lactamase class C family)
MIKRLLVVMSALVAITLFTGCGNKGTAIAPEQRYWPTAGWQTSAPEEQDVDAAKLNEAMDSLTRQSLPIDSLLVVRHGYIVYENYPRLIYDAETSHPAYSITKSFMSALIGIALKDGYIKGMDQKLPDLFPERTIQNMDELKKQITLEHLLTMTGGQEWNEWRYAYTDPRNDWIKALRSEDVVQYILDLPMAVQPGRVWNYNGGYSFLLSSLVSTSSRQSTLEFAEKHLFGPLGIKGATWSKHRSGIYDGAGGLQMTPRDMAKFGLLYLNEGKWDGKQIIPADFVAKSVSTLHTVSANTGYGYESWWTHPNDGIYYAAGIYGQRIYVVPELDLVVVVTANIQGADPEPLLQAMMNQYIIPACK